MQQLISHNTLEHFLALPLRAGVVPQGIAGIAVIASKCGSSMFNIAYGTQEQPLSPELLSDLQQAFHGHPFAWWIPPNQRSSTLGKQLLSSGFRLEAPEQAMCCNLDDLQSSLLVPQTPLDIKKVSSAEQLEDFLSVLEPYDSYSRAFYESCPEGAFDDEEQLFVGYIAGIPATISVLYHNQSMSSIGIFCLITAESYQRRGYGSDIIRCLLRQGHELGCSYATLSASSTEGLQIYQRLGFEVFGSFDCFEWGE